MAPLEDAFDPTRRTASEPGNVPQEHETPWANPTPAPDDSLPQDWSQLGRRVLAEAWRRTTEEVARRRGATPVVRSAHAEPFHGDRLKTGPTAGAPS